MPRGGQTRDATSRGGWRPARWLLALLAVAIAVPMSAPPGSTNAQVKGGLAGAPFTRDVLPGGLVVLIEERPGSGLVAMEVAVLAGARYERDATAGAAPFMERLLAAGTPTRPSRRDVLRAITSRGGDVGVSVGWERLRLTAETAAEDFDVALDLLSDMLLNSLFSRDRFEAERELILQDLAERRDNPSSYFGDVLYATVLGDPELRHLPAGSPEAVAGLTHDALLRFRADHVVRGNTVIGVAGDVSRAEILPKIAQAFAALPPGPRQRPRPVPTAAPPRQVSLALGSEQANIGVGVRAPSATAGERPALAIAVSLLGAGGQRLYQEIRDRRGLAYATGAGMLQMGDLGVLSASAGTDPANTAEVLGLLHAELARLREAPPSDEEVARAIAYYVNGQAVDLETNSARAGDLTYRETLYGTAPPRDYFIGLLRGVRPADVYAVAQRYLTPDRLITVVLGPE